MDVCLLYNFAAKEQSNFFKNLKAYLKGELIVIKNFCADFSLLIKNSIENHNLNNSRVTFQLRIIYSTERDYNNSLKLENFLLIPENSDYSTEAAYLFQSKLISIIKEIFF